MGTFNPEELAGKSADQFRDKAFVPDELQGKTPDELTRLVTVLDAHLRSLHQTDAGEIRHLTEVEQSAFDYGVALRERAMDMIEKHREIQDVLRRRPKAVENAFRQLADEVSEHGVRRLTSAEARDQALRTLDSRIATFHLSDGQKAQVERAVRRDPDIARRILVTENDDYRNAFMKAATDPHPIFTPEETRALQAWQEYRAMSEGTTTAGGFGIPVKLAA